MEPDLIGQSASALDYANLSSASWMNLRSWAACQQNSAVITSRLPGANRANRGAPSSTQATLPTSISPLTNIPFGSSFRDRQYALCGIFRAFLWASLPSAHGSPFSQTVFSGGQQNLDFTSSSRFSPLSFARAQSSASPPDQPASFTTGS